MTFEDEVEAGGTVLYPDGTVWTRAINSTVPVVVKPATPGATISLPASPAANFIAADGTPIGPPGTKHAISNNLWRTTGNLTGFDVTAAVNLNIQGPSDSFGGSVFWLRDASGACQAPNLDLTLSNGYGGPGNANTGGCQPNGVHMNGAGGRVALTWIVNAVAPESDVPFGLPDAVVFGGGPGFSCQIATTGFVEFDETTCPGITGTISAKKVLFGTLTSGNWAGSLLNCNLGNPPGFPIIAVNTPSAMSGLTLELVGSGRITFA